MLYRRTALIILLTLSLVIVSSVSASAKTYLGGPDFRPWMQTCINRSYVPTPTMILSVHRSNEPGRSWISPWDGQLYLNGIRYSRDNCQVLLHEIGHAFDWTLLRPANRRYIGCSILRQSSPSPWWSYLENNQWVGGGEGYDSPIERFAEAYKFVAYLPKVKNSRDWIPPNIGISYGLDSYFDYRRFNSFKSYIKKFNVNQANPEQTDQRTPLAPC